jgi:hypothetical protein
VRPTTVGAVLAVTAIVGFTAAVSGTADLAAAATSPSGAPARAALSSGAPAGATSRSGALAVVSARPAIPSGATALGAVPARRPVTGAVALRPTDPAGLARDATAVSTRGSATYHRYLAPGTFARWYAPAPTTVDAVEAQLRRAGLAVGAVSGNGLLVSFHGTAARTDLAFHTNLQSYRLSDGRRAYANATAARLPVPIAAAVQGVVGLSDLIAPQRIGGPATTPRSAHRTAPASSPGRRGAAVAPASSATATAGGPVACGAARGVATEYGGLTDTQIANAYGVNGLYGSGDTGVGETVALYELGQPVVPRDISTFDTCYFGAARAAAMMKRLATIDVDGGTPTGFGDEAELDVEDASAIAPGADIDVYSGSGSNYSFIDVANRIVTDDTANVVSISYGYCEDQLQQLLPGFQQIENTIWEQAAVQGQSIFASSGDSGSDSCADHGASPVAPVLSASDPASQPYVTAVGGTTITDATQPPVEQVWNDGADWGGGGGGISATWPQPAYQRASSVPGIDDRTVIGAAESYSGGAFCQADPAYAADPCREVPDVSAQADEFTGAITVYEEGWTTIGGTSSSSPLWAAMTADMDASRACGGAALGFVNPDLYALASVPAEYALAFDDVTVGDNDTFGVAGGLYPAKRGYDMASGLGTPKVTGPGDSPGLASLLCGSPVTAPPVVSSVTPAAAALGSSGTLTVTGTGFTDTAGPVVSGVQIGADTVPAADLTVDADSITLPVPTRAAMAGNQPVGDGSGTYDVTVSLITGVTSRATATARVTLYTPDGPGTPPVVDGVSPGGGNKAGGTPTVIYGSGLTGATSVSFGGVAVSLIPADVRSSDEIVVAAPAYSADATRCATGDSATTDVCQAQVTVTTPEGTSATSTILPELHGRLVDAPSSEEAVPAATEFDYLPTPHLTGVTYHPAAPRLASEAGGTSVTLDGTGLGYLGLEWIDVGPPGLLASETYSITAISGQKVTLLLPGRSPTVNVRYQDVYVQTLGSPDSGDLTTTAPPSNAVRVLYAPTPVVTSVTTGGRYRAGPASGGTSLTIVGHGFRTTSSIQFADILSPYGTSNTTAFVFHETPTSITLVTPQDNPGTDAVEVCNVTACTAPTDGSANDFTYYPRGDPTVQGISPASGRNGTRVVITGTNLGYIKAVYFGRVEARTFANGPGLLDSGDTDQVTATAPAGAGGSTVDVRVVTLESEATKIYPKSPVNRHVTFTYRR